MSQTSLLEEVEAWREEEYQARWREALPQLLRCYSTVEGAQKESDVLKLLCLSVATHIPASDLEGHLFSNIANKMEDSFSTILASVVDLVKNGSTDILEEIAQQLEVATTVVECIESCVKCACKSEDGDIEMSSFTSLPNIVLSILKGSYQHCKTSSSVYGELLGVLSERLSILFKRTHSLQMSFISLLDKVSIKSSSRDQDIEDFCAALIGLHELCAIVNSLDIKIGITTWKAVSKLACQHKEFLKDSLDVSVLVISLCLEMTSAYTYLFQLAPQVDQEGTEVGSGDPKAFSKSVKVAGFQMKVLVMLVKEFEGYLGNCVKEVYELLLLLLRYMPPSLFAPNIPKQYTEEIERQITIATEPLLVHYIGCHEFNECLMSKDDVDKEMRLPRCLLQIKVLGLLPSCTDDIRDMWASPQVYPEDYPRYGVLEGIFHSVAGCFIELSLPVTLPGVMCSGKTQRDGSLYEDICTKLCGFVGSLPARHFHMLEQCLLENVLSRNPSCALLAIDVWCFVARYGSAEVCHAHLCLIAELIDSQRWNLTLQHLHLVCLFRRLIKFLSQEHQEAFLKAFPISDHMTLWSHVPLTALPSILLQEVIVLGVKKCTKIIHDWVSTTDKTLETTQELLTALSLLRNILRSEQVLEKHVSAQHQAVLMDKCCALWSVMPLAEVSRYPVLRLSVVQLIGVTGHLASGLSNGETLKVVQSLIHLVKESPYTDILCEVAGFMKRLGRKTFPASFEQPQLFSLLPKLFSQLLQQPNPVVKQCVLESFSKFAEETSHESVVPDSLQQSEQAQEEVVNYLNKVPCTMAQSYSAQEFLHHVDITIKEWSSQQISVDRKTVLADMLPSELEPAAKRLKQDSEEQSKMTEKYQAVLNDLRRGTQDLLHLHSTTDSPLWVKEELKGLYLQIGEIL